jgi:CxxC motif-containing protein (DUF1111 family)
MTESRSRTRRAAHRALRALVLAALTAAPVASAADSYASYLGGPLPGLDRAGADAFLLGRAAFERDRQSEPGFGPFFNGVRCGRCHRSPAVGGGGAPYNSILHAGVLGSDGVFRPAPGRASSVVHAWSVGDVGLEPVPRQANALSARFVPPLFGVGLVEAIPDAQIASFADPNDADRDGISGRVVREGPRVARFGSQNQAASLRGFVEAAFREELGFDAAEVRASEVDLVVGYLRRLAPAPPADATSESARGEQVFASIGCASCHRTSFWIPPRAFTTAEGEAVDEAALQGVTIQPYSDFLLHDMGPGLDEGVGLGQARPAEYRTTPLWGLRHRRDFLHDGRAALLSAALRWHGGEAAAARAAYLALSAAERRALEVFLWSL